MYRHLVSTLSLCVALHSQVLDQVVMNPMEHSQLLMEISTAAKLVHPNIVRVIAHAHQVRCDAFSVRLDSVVAGLLSCEAVTSRSLALLL